MSSVTVCVPVYNGARYLRECLDSVLAQTRTEFDVLVVDDRSSDDSLKIARSYAEHDARVKIHENEKNQGLVGNWNRCVQLARGDWIKFCFQDDVLKPHCLEEMLRAGRELNKPLVVCQRGFMIEGNVSEEQRDFFSRYTDAIGKFQSANFKEARSQSAAFTVSADKMCELMIGSILSWGPDDVVSCNFVGEPTAVMFRRELASQAGGFDRNLVQLCDLEFWYRVGARDGLAFVPRELASFRVHGDAASQNNNRRYSFRKARIDALLLLRALAKSERHASFQAWMSRHRPGLMRRCLDHFTYLVWQESRAQWVSADEAQSRRDAWKFACSVNPDFARIERHNLFQRLAYRCRRRFGREAFWRA